MSIERKRKKGRKEKRKEGRKERKKKIINMN
jgi:hypothetical protein